MMMYLRAAYALFKTGPGLIALAVVAVWFSHAWGQYKGAHSQAPEIALLRGSLAAIERDREDNALIAENALVEVARLKKIKQNLEYKNEKNMAALNASKISQSCNACRISARRVRLLNKIPKVRHFSFRGAAH